MLATRSVGWRVNTPWVMRAAMVSWMARSDTRIRLSTSTLPKPSNDAVPPQAAAIEPL